MVEDVTRIRNHPLVPAPIPIYGYIYDVASGRLVEVPPRRPQAAPREPAGGRLDDRRRPGAPRSRPRPSTPQGPSPTSAFRRREDARDVAAGSRLGTSRRSRPLRGRHPAVVVCLDDPAPYEARADDSPGSMRELVVERRPGDLSARLGRPSVTVSDRYLEVALHGSDAGSRRGRQARSLA